MEGHNVGEQRRQEEGPREDGVEEEHQGPEQGTDNGRRKGEHRVAGPVGPDNQGAGARRAAAAAGGPGARDEADPAEGPDGHAPVREAQPDREGLVGLEDARTEHRAARPHRRR